MVLRFSVSSRKENPGLSVRRSDYHPSLGPTVVCERWRIFHQIEAELVDKELNGGVVVIHDHSNVLQVHQTDQVSSRNEQRPLLEPSRLGVATA